MKFCVLKDCPDHLPTSIYTWCVSVAWEAHAVISGQGFGVVTHCKPLICGSTHTKALCLEHTFSSVHNSTSTQTLLCQARHWHSIEPVWLYLEQDQLLPCQSKQGAACCLPKYRMLQMRWWEMQWKSPWYVVYIYWRISEPLLSSCYAPLSHCVPPVRSLRWAPLSRCVPPVGSLRWAPLSRCVPPVDRQSQKHVPRLLTYPHVLVQRSLKCVREAYTANTYA